MAVSVRQWLERRRLILQHIQPLPTLGTTYHTPHIAVALYLPRITTGGHGRARWVVDRWLLWAMDTFRSGQTWHQVVAHAGGRGGPLLGGIWADLWGPLRDSWLQAAGRGGWGQCTRVARYGNSL